MKVLVSMSGGVDSSVAAWLLKDQGHECTGINLKLFEPLCDNGERRRACCSAEDARDARSVALQIGIPFYVFNFIEDFREQVIDRFVKVYKTGATPNPCIDCNRFIKFNELLFRAQNLDYDRIATGHYARVDKNDGRYILLKGADKTKDQSYVLYTMTQTQLAKTLFPLGSIDKAKVRKHAADLGFTNAEKEESQDICFVPDGNYPNFISRYTGESFESGDIVDSAGNVLGRHKGIACYTVGQRRGLGISSAKPIYVKNIDIASNTVVVGREEELYSKIVEVKAINLIAFDKISATISVKAKLRYRHVEEDATVRQIDDDTVVLEFKNPQRAAAKGQAAVFYIGDMVAGGGTIV